MKSSLPQKQLIGELSTLKETTHVYIKKIISLDCSLIPLSMSLLFSYLTTHVLIILLSHYPCVDCSLIPLPMF